MQYWSVLENLEQIGQARDAHTHFVHMMKEHHGTMMDGYRVVVEAGGHMGHAAMAEKNPNHRDHDHGHGRDQEVEMVGNPPPEHVGCAM